MENASTSLKTTIKNSIKLYNLLGILVAAIAVFNFINLLYNFKLNIIFKQLIITYQSIVYTPIDWITYIFNFKIPAPIKDIFFLYSVIGGAFVRTKISDVFLNTERKIKFTKTIKLISKSRKIKGKISIPNDDITYKNRVHAAFANSNNRTRNIISFIFWPILIKSIFEYPEVRFNYYYQTPRSYPAGLVKSSMKPLIYDRRTVFFLNIGGVILGVFILIIVNAFLVI